jgi:hypothetical protein
MRLSPFSDSICVSEVTVRAGSPAVVVCSVISAAEWHEIAVKNALLTAEALARGEHEFAADFNARCRHANRMVLHLRSEPQRRFSIRPRDLPYRRSRVE